MNEQKQIELLSVLLTYSSISLVYIHSLEHDEN